MYDNIADEFNKTRYNVWKCVREFLTYKFSTLDRLLEAGCGNGKNLEYAKSLGYNVIGFDICDKFIDICKKKSLDVYKASILDPISPIAIKYNVILAIAVIHHLATDIERSYALDNLFNTLEPGGSLLITVWSYEIYEIYEIYDTYDTVKSRKFQKGDNIVSWNGNSDRYYYIYSKDDFFEYIERFQRRNYRLLESISIYYERQNWIAIINKSL